MRAVSLALSLMLLFIAISFAPAYAQTPGGYSFNLPPSSLTGCWFFGVSFNVAQGQPVTVQWSENTSYTIPVSLDFYIVPATAVQQLWLCEDGPAYLYSTDGALGTANWAAPWAGRYTALVVNYGYDPVSGMISVTTPNATLSVNPIGPYPVRREVCISANCIGG